MQHGRNISLIRALALYAVVVGLTCIQGCTEPAVLADSSLAFLYTTNTNAYTEPCGCCAEQAGGLSSRAGYVASQVELLSMGETSSEGVSVLVLDCGGFSDNSSELKQIQSVYASRGMELIGYDVVNLGQNETALGQGLLSNILDGFKQTKVVSANLKFSKPSSGEDHSRSLQATVRQFARMRVGQTRVFVTGVTASHPTQHVSMQASGIVVAPVFESLQAVFGKARSGELVVVLVNGLEAKAKAEVDAALGTLLKEKNSVGVIVGFGEIRNRQPYPKLSSMDVDKPFVTLLNGLDRGRGVSTGVLEVSAGGTITTASAGFEKLLTEIEPNEKISALMDELAIEATDNDRRLHAMLAGEPGQENSKYLGGRTCMRCHTEQFKDHVQTRHNQAFNTLKEIDEHENAMCLPCHTVGYGEVGGFLLEINELPALRGVGCESCHGPGTYHQLLQYSQAKGKPPEGANLQGLREVTEQTCLKCHTDETDLQWDYEKKLPLVDHSGGTELEAL